MADGCIDILCVAPSIWATILQKKDHCSRIWRVMLGVFVLDSFAITCHENFHRGMRVADGAVV